MTLTDMDATAVFAANLAAADLHYTRGSLDDAIHEARECIRLGDPSKRGGPLLEKLLAKKVVWRARRAAHPPLRSKVIGVTPI